MGGQGLIGKLIGGGLNSLGMWSGDDTGAGAGVDGLGDGWIGSWGTGGGDGTTEAWRTQHETVTLIHYRAHGGLSM